MGIKSCLQKAFHELRFAKSFNGFGQVFRRIDSVAFKFGYAGLNAVSVLNPPQLFKRFRYFKR